MSFHIGILGSSQPSDSLWNTNPEPRDASAQSLAKLVDRATLPDCASGGFFADGTITTFPAVNAVAILLALGYRALIPARYLTFALTGLFIAMVALNLVIYTAYLMPYIDHNL